MVGSVVSALSLPGACGLGLGLGWSVKNGRTAGVAIAANW